jgi:penicillin-binding protein 1C
MYFNLQSIDYRSFLRNKRLQTGFLISTLLFVFYKYQLPTNVFLTPKSIVIEDKDGNLLGAQIAKDGQWRFPEADSVPYKFATCITNFEDKRFYYHIGVDPISLVRAIKSNIIRKKVVSGGSTITMQLIRILKKNPSRNIYEKIKEATLAVLYDVFHTKKSILISYASNAPFGGNVVGVEAAAWRYFNKSPFELTWAESATLAVLPNAPSLIHPGRNQSRLLAKRNALLKKLYKNKTIDQSTYELGLMETLPDKPNPLPNLAPHLLQRANTEIIGKNKDKSRVKTTVNIELQNLLNTTINNYNFQYKANGINNLAAVILEVESGNILAYTGNAPDAGKENQQNVDIIRANRSTGSTLKPLLMAYMIQEGYITTESLIPDIPIDMNGYKPENFKLSYDGVVTVKKAISRSLNVPFVKMLHEYGFEKFHLNIRQLGLSNINKSADYYGLSMILGGVETNLLDLGNTYTCMARVLNRYSRSNDFYSQKDWRKANYVLENKYQNPTTLELKRRSDKLNAASIWTTLEAMTQVERPTEDGNWELFETNRKVAWKTGTSFGFKDAWSIGVTPKYVVAVWVGNADGEGRPGCIGVNIAAPVMFDIFNFLPNTGWFTQPYNDMKKISICSESGYLATELCESDTIWVPKSSIQMKNCPYHQLVHLDQSLNYRVNIDCVNPMEMVHKSWFVLPPIEEYYYTVLNPMYKSLPPLMIGCKDGNSSEKPMQLIYPSSFAKIKVPKDLNGKVGNTVFKVAHRNSDAQIYWHIDNTYIKTTEIYHDLTINPEIGIHKLTIVDNKGNRIEQSFEIVEK